MLCLEPAWATHTENGLMLACQFLRVTQHLDAGGLCGSYAERLELRIGLQGAEDGLVRWADLRLGRIYGREETAPRSGLSL